MKSLRRLDLSRCPKITDTGIKHLLSIPTLEQLSISQTGVTSDGVSLLSSLKNLSVLDLGGLPVIDDALCSLQVYFCKFIKTACVLNVLGKSTSSIAI